MLLSNVDIFTSSYSYPYAPCAYIRLTRVLKKAIRYSNVYFSPFKYI